MGNVVNDKYKFHHVLIGDINYIKFLKFNFLHLVDKINKKIKLGALPIHLQNNANVLVILPKII